jgi:hypothetical protein
MLIGLVALAVLLPTTALAQAPASPAPGASAPSMVGSGDSRSDGEGPGIVGSPVGIAIGVVMLGVVTAVGTVLVLRIGGPRRGA